MISFEQENLNTFFKIIVKKNIFKIIIEKRNLFNLLSKFMLFYEKNPFMPDN